MAQTITKQQKLDLIKSAKQYGDEYNLTPICGKMPFLKDYPNTHLTREKLGEHLRGEIRNDQGFFTEWTGFGAVLGVDMVVQDIDGDSALKELYANTTAAERDTFTTTSGSLVNDGEVKRQLYFRISEDRHKYFTKNIIGKHEDGEGTLRTKGAMCALPPSYHPDTRKPYYILNGSPDKLLPIPEYYLKIAIAAYEEAEKKLAEAKRRSKERLERRTKCVSICGIPPVSSMMFLSETLKNNITGGTKYNRDIFAGRLAMNLVAIEETLSDFTFFEFGREIMLCCKDDAEDIMIEWAQTCGFPEKLAIARLDRVRDTGCQMELGYHNDDNIYNVGRNYIRLHEDVILSQPDLPIVTHPGTKKPKSIAIASTELAGFYAQITNQTVFGIEDCRLDLCLKSLPGLLADKTTIYIVLPVSSIVNDGGKQVLNLQRCINKVIKDNNLNCKVVWIDYGQAQTNHALSSAVAGVGLGYDPIKELTANSRISEIADDALYGRVKYHQNIIATLGGEFYQKFTELVDCDSADFTTHRYLPPTKPKFGEVCATVSPMDTAKSYSSVTGVLNGFVDRSVTHAFALVPRTSLADQTTISYSKRSAEMGIKVKVAAFCPDSCFKKENQFLAVDCTGRVIILDEPTLWVDHLVNGGTFKASERTKIQAYNIDSIRAFPKRGGAFEMAQAGLTKGDALNLQYLFGDDLPIKYKVNQPQGKRKTVTMITAGKNTSALSFISTLLKQGERVAVPTYSEKHVRALHKMMQQQFPDISIVEVCSRTLYKVNNKLFIGDVNAYLAINPIQLLIYTGVMGTGVSIDVDKDRKAMFDYVVADYNGGSTDDKCQGMMRVRGDDVKRYAYINHINFGGSVKGENTVEETETKFNRQSQTINGISGGRQPIVTEQGNVINKIFSRLETRKKIESTNPQKTFKIKMQQLHHVTIEHIDAAELMELIDEDFKDLHAVDELYKTCRQQVVNEDAQHIIDAPTDLDPAEVARISKKVGQNPIEVGTVTRARIDAGFPEAVLKTLNEFCSEEDPDKANKIIGDLFVKNSILSKMLLRWFSQSKHHTDCLTKAAIYEEQMGRFNDCHTLIGRENMMYRRSYYVGKLRSQYDLLAELSEFSTLDSLVFEIYDHIRSLCPDMEQYFDKGRLNVGTNLNSRYKVVKYVAKLLGFDFEKTRRGVSSRGADPTRWYRMVDLNHEHYVPILHALNIKHKAHILRPSNSEVSLSYYDCKQLLEPDSSPVNWIKRSTIIDLTGMDISLEVALDLWFAESRHIKVGDVFTLLNHGIVQVVEISEKELILVSERGLIRAGFRSTGQ